ncbi:MAG: T9SS type A sorting domain-containing protein [Bacteroidetes bacterium]|nr:T9SS type A sorting domain-containing protein [Bacteroidota bacterium]
MKFFYTFLIFITINLSAKAQWIAQQSGTENSLSSVFFVNENTGFSVGLNVILKTTNGGNNWVKSDVTGYWNSVSFGNSTTGYICGFSGRILKTTDTGANWFSINSGSTKNFTSINFINSQTGYVTGWFKTFLSTTDGGLSFTNHFTNEASFMFQKTFFLNDKLFLIGSEGAYFKSTNSGTGFDSISISMPNSLLAMQFFPNGTGLIFGCCGIYFRSSDFGNSWSMDTVYLTEGWALYDCSFVNESTGWTVGESGSILRTNNGGLSWDSLGSGTVNALKSVKFVNQNTGWTVGAEGTILKTTNGGGQGFPIGINSNTTEIASKFRLSQNYPNPFNPVTTIKYDLPFSNNVTLKIYGLLGNEIETLVNEKQNAGRYSVNFNASSLPSGVYYYKLTTDKFSETKKMLLVK